MSVGWGTRIAKGLFTRTEERCSIVTGPTRSAIFVGSRSLFGGENSCGKCVCGQASGSSFLENRQRKKPRFVSTYTGRPQVHAFDRGNECMQTLVVASGQFLFEVGRHRFPRPSVGYRLFRVAGYIRIQYLVSRRGARASTS